MFDKLSHFFLRRRNWTLPYALFLLIFAIVPLLLIVLYAFTDADGAFTFANFRKFMMHPEAMNTFIYSIGIALITTLTCLLLGYPAAYILSQKQFNTSQTMVVLFILPMWVNILIRTLATVALFDFLNLPLGEGALVFGMVYNFLPFMVLPIYNVLCKIDDNTINAARDLGASFTQTLLWVWFPLSVPGIISGITMVFVPSLTTFVISNLLGGSKILLIGNVIEQEFTKGSNWNLGSGLSLVLMVFILISMALIAKYDKNGEGSTF